MHSLGVFNLRTIFGLLERLFLQMKMSVLCVFVWLYKIRLALQDSFGIFGILFCGSRTYSPTLLSWYVVASMPITEWLSHSHSTDFTSLFCHEFALAQDLTQIVDFNTRMIISHIFMTYSFVLILTPALLLLIILWENLTMC